MIIDVFDSFNVEDPVYDDENLLPDWADDSPPLPTEDELKSLGISCLDNNGLKLLSNRDINRSPFFDGEGLIDGFDPDEPWIQTHSGRRFNPLKPNPKAIVIQDAAHALSMLCRFTGHSTRFYSVAQHSVFVSYICEHNVALHGLLHDLSEFVLNDLSSPVKRSEKMQCYVNCEAVMQSAICERFQLSAIEPASVKRADVQLLATEARDLMPNLRSDWIQPVDPLPFKIEPWDPSKAKDMFIKRFFELTGSPTAHYEYYLKNKDIL